MKKFISKKKIALILVLLLLGGWWFLRPKNDQVEVKTAKVERKDLIQELTVSGKIQAEKRATLNFMSAGKLSFVKVTYGDKVKQGDWMAGLNTGDLLSAERSAYYTYLAYDAAAKKVEDDLKGKDGSETFTEKSTRVSAQTTRDKAYDAWLDAQRAVSYAVLKAPFDGVVTDVTVTTVGDNVGVTDGISVVDPSTISFETEVNENDLQRVFVGQEAYVQLDAFGEEKFVGKVKRIGFATKIGDTGATVLPLWIELGCGEAGIDCEKFKIGLNGDATLKLGEAKNTLVLPAEAVRDGKVVLEDKTEVEVQTGLESDFEIEIKSGLTEGQTVVIK